MSSMSPSFLLTRVDRVKDNIIKLQKESKSRQLTSEEITYCESIDTILCSASKITLKALMHTRYNNIKGS